MSENWIDNATEFAADSLAGVAGSSVVYSDGTVSIPNLKATLSTTTRDVVDINGAGAKWTAIDFLIRAKRLKSSGVLFLPAKGHTITWTRGNVTETYTVVNVPGEDCYKPEDQYGNTFRIHTKLTSST